MLIRRYFTPIFINDLMVYIKIWLPDRTFFPKSVMVMQRSNTRPGFCKPVTLPKQDAFLGPFIYELDGKVFSSNYNIF